MTERPTPAPQYGVWYFICATFAFAAPVIAFQAAAQLWVTIMSLMVGLLLVVAGARQAARDLRSRREADSGR
ncbi:hypothetical protein [Homoserinibacter sp. YIM 151385]|uniref:hypothetical protein n=1 Tax=Homoserinibacter sp. YIM 151385 TaxID=2985506 RepID=UPI0022F0FC27|nr:hypothetical protein [Homoserinibacter sp. YIM 151385]WBU38522.1 hypothetical protein OF852_02750 [Homoserinibacter sp. YIM 151385]